MSECHPTGCHALTLSSLLPVVKAHYLRHCRVCTSDGLTQLSEGLSQELLDNLHSIHESEVSTSS